MFLHTKGDNQLGRRKINASQNTMRRETYKKSEVTVGRKIKLPNVTDRTRKKKSTKTPDNWKNIFLSLNIVKILILPILIYRFNALAKYLAK